MRRGGGEEREHGGCWEEAGDGVGGGGLAEQRPFFCAVHLHNVAGVLHAALSAGPRVCVRVCVCARVCVSVVPAPPALSCANNAALIAALSQCRHHTSAM